MKVILTGYIHSKNGEFVYTANGCTDPTEALFLALTFAAGYPSDFEGTVTARLMKEGE